MTTDHAPLTGARALLAERLRGGREVPVTPAVPRRRSTGPLPLTPAQRDLWLAAQVDPESTAFTVPIVLRWRDREPATVRSAFAAVVQRHEVLRTGYRLGPSGEPEQFVDPGSVPVPRHVELPPGRSIEEFVHGEMAAPLRLDGLPFRATTVTEADGAVVLVLLVHHIAVDGPSVLTLIRDLDDPPGPAGETDQPTRFSDVAAFLADRGSAREDALAFWRERLDGCEALELPDDCPPERTAGTEAAVVRTDLGEAGATALGAAASRLGTSPTVIGLTALAVLLHRLTGTRDLLIGTPVSDRTEPALDDVVGCLTTLRPIRITVDPRRPVDALVHQVRQRLVEAIEHTGVTLGEILATDGGASTRAHPLISTSFALHESTTGRNPGTAQVIVTGSRRAKYDLEFELRIRSGAATLSITHPADTRTEATVTGWSLAYAEILRRLAEDPRRRPDELVDGHPDDVAAPRSIRPSRSDLVSGFREQVARHPQRPAVITDGGTLSYAVLDALSDRLAARIRSSTSPGDHVGLLLHRDRLLLVGVLGILKAGCAYVPVEPSTPRARLTEIGQDSGAELFVTDQDAVGGLPEEFRTILLDRLLSDQQHDAPADDAPLPPPSPEQIAYLIYTSGSTGRPKGVPVPHRSVCRLFDVLPGDLVPGPQDVWSMTHSISFDFSVWEIWGALLHGGAVVVVPQQIVRSPWDLGRHLAEAGVTMLSQTPTAFSGLTEAVCAGDIDLDELSVRAIVFGGEAIEPDDLRRWWAAAPVGSPRLINMYGITETTVHVTATELTPESLDARTPIGPPLADLRVRILDDDLRPTAVGGVGEICVAGAGVNLGYWGRPALTAERFVPDPHGVPGSRLYRSGDRGRRGDGGTRLEHWGRADGQVKIHGYRIELGEVRAAVLEHPGVAAAAVITEGEAKLRRLLAFVVPGPAGLSTGELKEFLAHRLPAHCIPSTVTVVDRIPTTVNGKLDTAALLAGRGEAQQPSSSLTATADGVGAGVTVEQMDAWRTALAITTVGPDDDFFDLGGDSIRAVHLVSLLRALGSSVSVQELFALRTPAGVAALDEGRSAPGGATTTPVTESSVAPFALLSESERSRLPQDAVDAYPLAQLQAGMVHELLRDPERRPYHNTTSYLIRDDGPFDVDRLDRAWAAVVARHPMLRTSIRLSGARALQVVHRTVPTRLHTVVDLRGLPAAEQARLLVEFRRGERADPFVPDEHGTLAGPLLRFSVHRVGDRRWHLTLTEHHAVLDGWSHNSLLTELLHRYRDPDSVTDEPPTVRYSEFVRAELQTLESSEERAFWDDHLATGRTIPLDPDPQADDRRSTAVVVVDYLDLVEQLDALARRCGVPQRTVLLTAHLLAWAEVSGVVRARTGTVHHGRPEHGDAINTLGLFLNSVPLVTPAFDGTFEDAVRAVWAEESRVLPHRHMPLAALQRRTGSGEPLVTVAFNYLRFHVLDQELIDETATVDDSPNEVPAYTIVHLGRMHVMSRPECFSSSTVHRVAAAMRSALVALATRPSEPVDPRLPVGAIDPGSAAAEIRRRHPRLLDRPDGVLAGPPVPGPHLSVAAVLARCLDRAQLVMFCGGDRLAGNDLRQAVDLAGSALLAAGTGGGSTVAVGSADRTTQVTNLLACMMIGAHCLVVDEQLDERSAAAAMVTAGATVRVGDDGVIACSGTQGSDSAVEEPGCLIAGGHGGPGDGVVELNGATLLGRCRDLVAALRISRADVVVVALPAGSPGAALGILTAVLTDARLVVPTREELADASRLRRLLDRRHATVVLTDAAGWQTLETVGWRPPVALRALSLGEPLSTASAHWLQDNGCEVWDSYGTVETGIFCLLHRLDRYLPGRTVVAGGATITVVDDAGRSQPRGRTGMIAVGGDRLATGYRGDADATAARFRPDPDLAAGRRILTGDRGRVGPGRTLELMPHQRTPGPLPVSGSGNGGAISTIWRDLTGADGDAMTWSPDTDFFEAGGHSLDVLALLSAVESATGVAIPYHRFMASPTLGAILEQVDDHDRVPTNVAAAVGMLAPLGSPTTHQPRVFCAPTVTGSVHWYEDLADALPSLGVLGLIWPGVEVHSELLDPDEALDRLTAAVLEAAGPEQPWLLGWSAAVGIAAAVAARIDAIRPTGLVLLDPVLPGVSELAGDPSRARSAAVHGLQASAAAARQHAVTDQIAALAQRPTVIGDRTHTVLVLTAALRSGEYPNLTGGDPEEYLRRWRQITGGRLTVIEADGDHWSVVRPPIDEGVSGPLAALIRSCAARENPGDDC